MGSRFSAEPEYQNTSILTSLYLQRENELLFRLTDINSALLAPSIEYNLKSSLLQSRQEIVAKLLDLAKVQVSISHSITDLSVPNGFYVSFGPSKPFDRIELEGKTYLWDDGSPTHEHENGFTYGWSHDFTNGQRSRTKTTSPYELYDELIIADRGKKYSPGGPRIVFWEFEVPVNNDLEMMYRYIMNNIFESVFDDQVPETIIDIIADMSLEREYEVEVMVHDSNFSCSLNVEINNEFIAVQSVKQYATYRDTVIVTAPENIIRIYGSWQNDDDQYKCGVINTVAIVPQPLF